MKNYILEFTHISRSKINEAFLKDHNFLKIIENDSGEVRKVFLKTKDIDIFSASKKEFGFSRESILEESIMNFKKERNNINQKILFYKCPPFFLRVVAVFYPKILEIYFKNKKEKPLDKSPWEKLKS